MRLNSPNLKRKWCSPYSYSSLHFNHLPTFHLLQKNFHAWVFFFSILLRVHLEPENKKVTMLTYGKNYCPSLQCNGLEWTSSHQCNSSGQGHSSCYEDEPKTHPLPLPRDFSTPFSPSKFSLLSPLPPTSFISFHQSLRELPSLIRSKLQG